MRQTLRLGRVAGIAVGVHWSVLVIAARLVDGLAGTILPGAAPGLPEAAYLDGGRVLRAALWRWHGDRNRAAASAARVGHALGMVLVLAGLAEVLFLRAWGGLWLALVGWFLLSAAGAEAAAGRYRTLLGRVP